MRTAVVGLVALLLHVTLGAAVQAGDPEDSLALTPEQAADAALEAVRAKDGEALDRVAARDEPDPWQVADELCFRGAHSAAESFARAAPRKDTESLPAYVLSRRDVVVPAATREALKATRRLIRTKGPKAALDASKTATAGRETDPIPWIAIQHWRGLALRRLGRHAESAETYHAAAERAADLGWLSAAATMWRESGVSAARHRDYPTARARWQAHLGIEETRGNVAGAAVAHGDLGNVYHCLGAHGQALSSYHRAIEISEARGDVAHVARLLSNVGVVHSSLGAQREALSSFRRSLALRGPDSPQAGVATTLCNISRAHRRLGEYPEAIATLHRALEVATSLNDRAELAMAHNHMGLIHWRVGEFEKALASYRRALEIRTVLGDMWTVATILGNIGLAQEDLGEHEAALSSHRRSLELGLTLNHRTAVARAISNTGNIQFEQGRYEDALASHRRAFEMAEALGNLPAVASTLGNIGGVLLRLGRLDKAVEAQERALAVLERFPAPEVEGQILYGLARTHLAQGRWDDALRRSREAVAVVDRVGRGLSDEEGVATGDLWSQVYEVGARASIGARNTQALAYFLESGRAGSLRAALGARETLRSVVIPESIRREEALSRAAETRAMRALREAARSSSLRDARRARKSYDAARARTQELVGRIQRESQRGASIAYPAADDLARMQSHVGPSEALVLYGLFAARGVALVVRPSGARFVELPDRAAILEAADALDVSDVRRPTTEAVAALRHLLIEPLALEADVQRLLVSPAGRLGYLPFALLAPEMEVAYVPSGTTYGLLLEDRDERGEGVLALGDPDYRTVVDETARDVSRGAGLARLRPLPATREEALALAEAPLLGKDATEANLRTMLNQRARWRAVHLACHGLVDPDRPLFSSLAITADRQNDGFLSCLDVFRMRIPADLVVLSACETGKGKIYRTEGIVGLTRAFMFAGAPRVICSLWKVDDEATRALMVKFYELWNPKQDGPRELGAAAALRKAQEYVCGHEKWKHPYYWAAWVLWGLPD